MIGSILSMGRGILSAVTGSKVMIMVAVAVAGAGGTYYYVTSKQIDRLKDEVVEIAVLNQSLKNDVIVLEKVESTQNALMADLKRLQKRLKERENELSNLRDLLFDHDLTNLSIKKPGLIETRVNNATKKILEDIGNSTIDTTTDKL